MAINATIGRGRRALAVAAAISAMVFAAQAPSPAYAADVGTAVGLGILGGAVAGAAVAGAANPYYAPGYYPYGYAAPAAPYYPPAAPYYQAPRSCWDPYYRRYY